MMRLGSGQRRAIARAVRLTNYKAGFQLDTISGASNENYDYDANGRLTLIERDGKTIDLEHDAGDRLTTVENETTGKTTQYIYDGAGNRVKAIEGGNVRQFLVAPAMGSGLESNEAIADKDGNLISNYIYAGGHTPFMMLDAQGNPVYYLTDAMGTVIGLANGSGQETADFRYDSFGNFRSATGSAVNTSAVGGDFRFQGQWLESETGIYYFRARDYDAQTGRFLSRDPVDIIETEPESMNPYQFVYNNPYMYSDPTGMFSIAELNATQAIQDILANIRTFAGNQAKEYAKEKIGDAFGEVVASVFKNFVPGFGFGEDLFQLVRSGDNLASGIFETFLADKFCEFFEGIPLAENFRITPKIKRNGTPITPGINCAGDDGLPNNRVRKSLESQQGSKPDFIFINGKYLPKNPGSYLIGDIKLIQRAAYKDVVSNDNQWQAMSNYAREYQLLPFVSYISLLESAFGEPGVSKSDKQKMAGEALEKGVVLVLVNLVD